MTVWVTDKIKTRWLETEKSVCTTVPLSESESALLVRYVYTYKEFDFFFIAPNVLTFILILCILYMSIYSIQYTVCRIFFYLSGSNSWEIHRGKLFRSAKFLRDF